MARKTTRGLSQQIDNAIAGRPLANKREPLWRIGHSQAHDQQIAITGKASGNCVWQVRLPGIKNDTVHLACIQNREILAAASELKCDKPGWGRTIVSAVPAHSARIVKPGLAGECRVFIR